MLLNGCRSLEYDRRTLFSFRGQDLSLSRDWSESERGVDELKSEQLMSIYSMYR